MTNQVMNMFKKVEKDLIRAKTEILNHKIKWEDARNRSNHIDQARVNTLTGINNALQEIKDLRNIYGF